MLTALMALLVAIIALLAIPLSLTFQVCWRREFTGDLGIRWAFGLVETRIPLPRTETPVTSREDEPAADTHARRARERRTGVIAAVRRPDFRRRVLRFAGAMWRAVGKQDVCVHLRLGLGDPADTGRLWALVGPLSGMLAGYRDAELHIQPDFLDAALDFEGRGVLRLIPLRLVGIVFGLAVSPSFWRGISAMRTPG